MESSFCLVRFSSLKISGMMRATTTRSIAETMMMIDIFFDSEPFLWFFEEGDLVLLLAEIVFCFIQVYYHIIKLMVRYRYE